MSISHVGCQFDVAAFVRKVGPTRILTNVATGKRLRTDEHNRDYVLALVVLRTGVAGCFGPPGCPSGGRGARVELRYHVGAQTAGNLATARLTGHTNVVA